MQHLCVICTSPGRCNRYTTSDLGAIYEPPFSRTCRCVASRWHASRRRSPRGACHICRPLCSARMLHVTASTQRTGRASFGSVMFTDTGPRSCALRGRVGVRLLDSRGRALPVQYVYRKSDLYGRRIFPYVVLTPHAKGAGYVQLLWRNWCGAPRGGPRFRYAVQWAGLGGRGATGYTESDRAVMYLATHPLHGVDRSTGAIPLLR